MDVKAIQARLAAHAVERNWDPFFSPRSLSMAVAGEAGALLAIFRWLSEDQARRIAKTHDRNAVAESIADVVLYTLRLAETVDIDLEEAVLARAAEKYPVSARRFEGVYENDSPASAPAPREFPQPVSSASARSASAPRHSESDAGRTPPRTATARDEPSSSAAPVPARPQTARPAEDDPGAKVRAEPDPAESRAVRAPPRSEPQTRGRAESVARERSEPPPRARTEPPARERADPPARERAATPARPEPPARAERYANLDTDSVLDLMKGLKKRIDDSRSDDTILHEIKDEMDTLRRNLYSSKSKPAWIAGGLERLRALLEEAVAHPVGDKINFRDYIARITSMLEQ